jgi:hypothetical protein
MTTANMTTSLTGDFTSLGLRSSWLVSWLLPPGLMADVIG